MELVLTIFGEGLHAILIVMLAAIMVGFSKSGINGITMLIIPLLASVYGGKASTGILLPMLIVGDIYAVWCYRKTIHISSVLKPLPWSILGIIMGGLVGNYISDDIFIYLIGSLVILCLILLVYSKFKGGNIQLPSSPYFYIVIGILSGFASMIGNAAGPIFTLYLLALGYNKKVFMGTNALFFFIINVSKLPIQIFLWDNISVKNGILAFIMMPIIGVGAFLGYHLVKKINEKVFSYIIIIMTWIGAIRLFI